LAWQPLDSPRGIPRQGVTNTGNVRSAGRPTRNASTPRCAQRRSVDTVSSRSADQVRYPLAPDRCCPRARCYWSLTRAPASRRGTTSDSARLDGDSKAVASGRSDRTICCAVRRGGRRCLFVGDAKYKLTDDGRLSDLYQLLAYCVATGLGTGLLIYAEQPTGPVQHQIVHGGPALHVEGVDVTSPVPAIETRLDEIAAHIRQVGLPRLTCEQTETAAYSPMEPSGELVGGCRLFVRCGRWGLVSGVAALPLMRVRPRG
jgi:hypothetical protein